MKEIKIKANAKINLSLIITGVMEDGYHDLDSIMCPIDLSDYVVVSRREDKEIMCQCLDISDCDNIAIKAARLLMEEFDTNGVDITIEKNIPVSAGLGGSSADAAAVMYAFSKLFYIDYDKIKFLARQIGSDIPFLMQVITGAMRSRGRGDILTAEDIDSLDIVIAKPSQGVETKTAYKLYDEMAKGNNIGDNSALVNALRNNEDICDYLINDLYLPAKSINNEIEPLLKLMKELNNDCAIMSGSGSAVIAICNGANKAQEVYDSIPETYYRLLTKTCKKGIEEVYIN